MQVERARQQPGGNPELPCTCLDRGHAAEAVEDVLDIPLVMSDPQPFPCCCDGVIEPARVASMRRRDVERKSNLPGVARCAGLLEEFLGQLPRPLEVAELLVRPREVEEHELHVVFGAEVAKTPQRFLERCSRSREVSRLDRHEALEEGRAGDAPLVSQGPVQSERLVRKQAAPLVVPDVDGGCEGARQCVCASDGR